MNNDRARYWGGISGQAFSTGPPAPVPRREDFVLPNGYVIRRNQPRLPELATPEKRWRGLPATSPEDHLYAMDALRIEDPNGDVSGDWHKEGNWCWIALRDHPPECAPTSRTEPRLTELENLLGTERVVEVRQYFVDLHHPDATRYRQVWASAHERAVVDLAWLRVQTTGTVSGRTIPLRARCRWVSTTERQDWCLATLDRVSELLSGRAKDAWRKWTDEWRYATSDEEPYFSDPVKTDD